MKNCRWTVVVIILLLLGGCSASRYRSVNYLLGTRIQLLVEPVAGRDPAKDVAAVWKRLKKIEQLADPRRRGTPVEILNRTGSWDAAQLPRNSFSRRFVTAMFALGVRLAEQTGGCFDPAVGRVTAVWGFSAVPAPVAPPDRTVIRKALAGSGIALFSRNGTVYRLHKGAKWDPGGYVKGMAAMEAVKLFKAAGYRAAVIDLGGDLYLLGSNPRRSGGWSIGIRHPRRPGGYAGSLQAVDMAVVTSGDYERCYFSNGKRYHHLLDPRTGYPARRTVSVTVAGPDAAVADGLATALFVCGPLQGKKMLQRFPGYHAAWSVVSGPEGEKLDWHYSARFRSMLHWQKFSAQR